MKKPIGVFDSGIGGLTVLKELQRALPYEHFVYFADTANLPYGDKTPEQIIDYTRQTVAWIQNEIGAKLVVAACHTSSAIALDLVSPEFSIPVIGAIYPMVETILNHYQNRRIGIIATPTSVQSRMHENILTQSGFKGALYSISCPKFVPIIESGRISGPELLRATRDYLRIFNDMELDTLVYGCTHYPWIADTLRQALPLPVDFVDPAEAIAVKISQELYKTKIINTSSHKVPTDFYCSSAPERFCAQVNLLMSIPKPRITLVTFENHDSFPEKIAINQ
jgi:glutamate racemase